MGQYTSYYLYQKYESRGGQTPTPCSPNVYSIDAEGTMEKVIKMENDPDCGYTPPPTEPIYRWYQIPITEDYICADCPSGTTIERWVNSGTTCSEGDLYNLQIKQISFDSGSTWENTSDTQLGELIEVRSPMCNKVVLTLSDSSNVYVKCNNSTTLYYSEISGYTGARNATVGLCVTTIGQEAFYGKPLTAITLPNSVTTIGNAAFMTCNKLLTISLNDVISIGDNAFQTCSGLTSVEIGSGITYIGWAAFEGCTSLTSITINATTPPTLHRPSAYPNTFNNTNNCPIYVPYGSIGAYKAAWTNYASRIYGIGYLERWVNLDPSVDYYCEGNIKYYKQQKQWSMDGSTWFDVDPPEYQMGSEIGSSSDCTTPTGNKFSASYTTGSTYTLECNESSTLSRNETSPTGYDSYYMSTATIGNCVTDIGDSAFSSNHRLTSVTIPNTVTYIGGYAFYGCGGLTSIDIPDSVTSIDSKAFQDCSGLTSVSIPNSVTSINTQAFYRCSGLTSVTIGNGVTNIGESAFTYCTSITSCTIGGGVTRIRDYAFNRCSGLISVTINAATPPALGSSVFGNTNNCPIYVPSEAVNTYKNNGYWSTYASRIQAIP